MRISYGDMNMNVLLEAFVSGNPITEEVVVAELREDEPMRECIAHFVRKEPITESVVALELFEVCDRVHASCDSSCPVYHKAAGKLPDTNGTGCDCFKNGKAMLEFLRA